MKYFIIIISLLLSLATSAQASDPVRIIEETHISPDSVEVGNSVYITNYDFGENNYTVYFYHYYQDKSGKVKRAVLGRVNTTLSHYEQRRFDIPEGTNHILVTSSKKGKEYSGAYRRDPAIKDS